jgi:hypothetical protein
MRRLGRLGGHRQHSYGKMPSVLGSPSIDELHSVKRSTGRSIVLLMTAAICSSAIAGERGLDRETYTLQYDFGTATDLTVEPRWQSVPPDLATILKHIASHLVIGKSTFANIGEEWAPGDAVEVNLPQAQHLFSAYSDKVAASIFLLGGSEVRVYGVLSRRRAQSFCIFKLPYLDLSSLRMSIVQYELRPDRDQTVSTIPRCQPQSLSRSLELPSDR